jgi:hypothetical protein
MVGDGLLVLALPFLFVAWAHAGQPRPLFTESLFLERFPLPVAAVPRPGTDLLNPKDEVSSGSFRYAQPLPSGRPFLNRISARLDRAGVVLPADYESQPRPVTRTIERSIVRATQREVKDMLVEALEIHDVGRSEKNGPSSDARGAYRFRFGVSHLAPKLDLRCRVGQSALNVSVNVRGQVGLDLNSGRVTQTVLHVGYDLPTKSFGFSFRLRS